MNDIPGEDPASEPARRVIPAPGGLARLFPDLPVPADTPLEFEFQGLAVTLAELAFNPDNPTPFTAVVRGGWGRGKTTLLRRVEHLLSSDPRHVVGDATPRQVKTLWFNAWKYPSDDTVLAGLLGELLLRFETGSLTERLKGFLDKNKSRGIRNVLKHALPAPVRAALEAAGLLGLLDPDPTEGPYADAQKSRAFYDTFRELFGRLSHLLFVGGDLLSAPTRVEELWNAQSCQKYTVAVFLDDLDRCPPERVMQVLEAINLFLDLPGVCFYMGLDWERLTQLLPTAFQDHADQFLEKIIQVSFPLPQVGERDAGNYIRKLTGGTMLREVFVQAGEAIDVNEIDDLARALRSLHPRHIKRFLNDLSMGLAVLRNTGRLSAAGEPLSEGTHLVPIPAVVAWHILAEVLPPKKWNEIRAGIGNARPFLEAWSAGREKPEGDKTPEDLGEGVERLRGTDLLARYTRTLNALSNAQLESLILLASPRPPEKSLPTPASGGMELADVSSSAWVEIPAGEFTMGSEKYRDEKPPHPVRLDAFRISKYPVTNAQYAPFVAETGVPAPSHWREGRIPEGKENHPVTNVDWNDAEAFAAWLSKKSRHGEGDTVGLPTEAQWEYAARGADAGRRYPWGNDEPTPEHANYGGRIGDTSPVDVFRKGATPEGVYDMGGNVWEWCRDWMANYPKSTAPVENPTGPERGALRVLRGASFDHHPVSLRCANRGASPPGYRLDNLGFRLVWSLAGGQR